MNDNFTIQQKNFIKTLKAYKLYTPFRIIIMKSINSWVDLEIIPKTKINEKIREQIDSWINFKKRFGLNKTILLIKQLENLYSTKYYLQI